MEHRASREAKNSVFIDMFQQPENQLEMLRVFHPEMTDVTAEDIKTITLKQVITNHQYNDLAFLVRDVLMVFVEAQSTWSVNVAVRILLYLADTVQEYIHTNHLDIHSTEKLQLPKPEFYVIYTGSNHVRHTLSLRDDFFGNDACPLDLRARVFNAETQDIIGQYIIFSHIFDEQVKLLGRTEEAARETIRICKNRGVLKTYLESREKEVVNIMIMLFDQQYATEAYARNQALIAEKRGRQLGQQIGQQIGMITTLKTLVSQGLITIEDAAKQAGMTVAEFEHESGKLN